jgi:ABC-type branched-subunit amino acid transport system ATPase component
MKTRRRLLSWMVAAVPIVALAPRLAAELLRSGARRAVAPGRALLARMRIVPLDEERIGPTDDLAG